MSVNQEGIDFSDFSGGLNTTLPRHALAPNQAAGLINLICERQGGSFAPGYQGGTVSAMFAGQIRGMWDLVLVDGTEALIIAAEEKTWVIDTTVMPFTRTQIGTLSNDNECWAVNAVGKLWLVNGTDFVKIEKVSTTYVQYRVGIAAPTGGSATASAGGSLPDGVYDVYYSYARFDSNGQVLYSAPYSLGNKTLGGGSNSVAVVPVISADPQVTHIVVWMTDAGGAVQYYFKKVSYSVGLIVVTSTSDRNASIRMDIQSAPNVDLPISPVGIIAANDELIVWGNNSMSVYWSLKTDVSTFDLERFLSANFRTFSATIGSMFTVGNDLFVNHIGNGVDILTNGDFSSVAHRVEKRFWFIPSKTVDGRSYCVPYKGMVFGLTNDGFKYFNGTSFSENLSFNIKPEYTRLLASAGSYYPSMVVNDREGKRTEFRISYCDYNVSNSLHNSQLVFNLDAFFGSYSAYQAQYSQEQDVKAWEYWETGFSHMCTHGGYWIGAQGIGSSGTLVIEKAASDINCYSKAGEFLTVLTPKELYFLSRTFIDALDGITVWGAPYTLATSSGDINGNIIIFDSNNSKFPFVFSGVPATYAVLPSDSSGLGLALPFIMSGQYPIGYTSPMPYECRGNSVAIEISRTDDDPYFFLYKLQLPRAQQIKHKLT